MLKKGILLSVMLLVSINANAFMDDMKAQAQAQAQAASSTGQETLISNLENVGISSPADQTVWSDFLNNCVKNHVSVDKLASLASGGTEGILNFLNGFSAPANIMTEVYNKTVSCPSAVPVVKKIISSISTN